MDLNLIKKLIRILEASEVTDLEIEENGTRVKLAKKVRVSQTVSYAQAPLAHPMAQNSAPVDAKTEVKKSTDENAGLHEIKSPIVEAIKLMNEIESDASGKIVKILVENGKPVEYNQPLFLLQKS